MTYLLGFKGSVYLGSSHLLSRVSVKAQGEENRIYGQRAWAGILILSPTATDPARAPPEPRFPREERDGAVSPRLVARGKCKTTSERQSRP